MQLEGSCHCGAVHFGVLSHTPYPFMRCYCSICRKTAGGGGYAINIMGQADTLSVRGRKHVAIYRVLLASSGSVRRSRSPTRRHFCVECGSALWAWDPRWPEWVYPFASAIDTALPKPAQHVELMLADAAPWVTIPKAPGHTHFAGYPDESIIDWHRKRGLDVD